MKLKHLYSLWDRSGCEKKLRHFTKKENKFAIYGAGRLGIRTAAFLKSEFGVSPVAFIDMKAENGKHYVDDIPVVTPCELMDNFGDIYIGIAVAEYHCAEKSNSIDECLTASGFSRSKVVYIGTANAYPNAFIYMDHIDREKTLETIDMLYDSFSKEQYYSYIYARVWKTKFFAPTYPHSLGYCATDLFSLHKDDHVLDCGAYDGDTARIILSNFSDVKNITMLEPDLYSYGKLHRWIETVSDKNLKAIPKAASNINGTIGFISMGTSASRMADDADENIECCRIDDMEFETPPTIIKMDVEGAELEALKGARNTILKYAPKLAISVYHLREDLIAIPEYILSINTQYELYLRHYESFSSELILYAKPKQGKS
jgi:FkbM family methyltransferase